MDSPIDDGYCPAETPHYLEVDETELTFTSDGGIKDVYIRSSQNWCFDEYADWLSMSHDKGSGSLNISINATENSYPNIRYTKKVIIAIIITLGTKYPETVSAILAIGALVLLASTTSLTISEIVDSFPILSALYSI